MPCSPRPPHTHTHWSRSQVVNASELRVAEQKLVKSEKQLSETKNKRTGTVGRWGKLSRVTRRPFMNVLPERQGRGVGERAEGLRPASIATREAAAAEKEAREKALQQAEEHAARAAAAEKRTHHKKGHHFGGKTERKMVIGLNAMGQALSAVQH